jgi:predicted heme/steroid binding protein/uncharacterized membrane protein
MSSDKKTFSPEELAQHDGKKQDSTYIAYQGRVIDVSNSKLWPKGVHMKRHEAGQDLTEAFQDAPHGTEVLDRYPEIGSLPGAARESEAESRPLPRIVQRFPMLKRHPHPMTVHFPIVFSMAAVLFTLLYLVSGHGGFEATAWHCLGANILFTPVAILTGLYTWWLNYMAQPLRPVIAKLILSPVLLAVSLIAFFWRLVRPELLIHFEASGLIYLLLVLVLFPLVTTIGWFGASLTFPVHKE